MKDGMELVSALQNCQKRILSELDRVCRENGLRYCLAFGTCLGAIRHKGFIPWDDDIDIYMPIADFEMLKGLQGALSEGFFFQTNESDPEYGLLIGRLCDSNTTLIEKTETDRDINHGVFVDIYPLYYVPDSRIAFKRLVCTSMLCRLMLYERVPQNRGAVMKLGSAVLLKLVPRGARKKLVRRLRNVMVGQKVSNRLSGLYADDYYMYPADWFFPAAEADFDGMRVPIPRNADAYLTNAYGDYMKLPPEEKRVIHHDFALVDFDHPYTKYKGEYYCKGAK